MDIELSTLKSVLLESLFDESALEPALERYARACNAPIAQLMVADGVVVEGRRSLIRSAFSVEIDDALGGAEHHYQHINPRVLAIPKMRVGHSIRDKDFISWDEVKKDQTYQELIVPAGLGHGSLVPFIQSPSLVAGIALHRPITADPFSDREARIHEYVSRICAGVFELADKVTNRNERNVLDMFGPGQAAALVNRAGRVVDYNDAYEAMCIRRGVSIQKGQRPSTVRLHAVQAWKRAIDNQSGTIQLSCLDDHEPYLFCTLVPTPHVGQNLYKSSNTIALFREELNPGGIDADGFQRDFSLTAAETETAILVACTYSVREISKRRRVSIETTRTLLKRALEKVGKKRQSELVRLVSEYRLI